MCLSYSTSAVFAADKGYVNYDGDTLRATFRIANIDTPEIKGECEFERNLAQKAKAYTAAWLAKRSVTIRQIGVDRYGRVLALVQRDAEDLGESLIQAGLARPWRGKREIWCFQPPITF